MTSKQIENELRNLKKQQKLKEINVVRDRFFDTTPSKVHSVSQHESIFTKRFLEILINQLGDADTFIRMNRSEQIKVSEKINNLLITETSWKALISKVKYEEHIILKMFSEEYKCFERLFREKFFPHGEKLNHKQVIEKFASTKCEVFYEYFFKALQKKGIVPEDSEEVTIDYKSLVTDIDPMFLFKDLVKLSMKKAFDQNINISGTNEKAYYSRTLESPFLYVKRSDLLYSLQEVLVVYLGNQVVSVLDEGPSGKGKIWNTPTKRVSFVYEFFKENKKEFLNTQCSSRKTTSVHENNWFKDSFSVANIIIDFFGATDVVIGIEALPSRNNDSKTHTIMWLTHKMRNTIPFSHHLPRILPPRKLNRDTRVSSFVKSLVKGVSSVSISNGAIEALNVAQKKKMCVNVTYLKLLDQWYNNPPLEIEGLVDPSFPTSRDVREKEEELDVFEKSLSVNALQRYIFRKANTFLSYKSEDKARSNDKAITFSALRVANASRVEMDLNKVKKKLNTDLSAMKAKRQLLQTSITLASIYKGFPLFYGTKLDYRTRMYPWEYLLSRATGTLKHLLRDFQELPLTIKGIISLMEAYFRFSHCRTFAFRAFLRENSLSKKTGFKKLEEFFIRSESFENDFDFKDQICYALMLKDTLKKLFHEKVRRTGVMIEIDQKASGMMILALVLGLKKLADVTNLTDFRPQDVYIFLMDHIEEFFSEATFDLQIEGEESRKVPFVKGRVLSFLSTSRSVNKGALMRWSYGEGARSRGLAFTDAFKEFYKSDCTHEEWETLKAFASQYDEFLESLFPGLKERKGYLLQALMRRAKETKSSNIDAVQIKTLDGCSLSWDYTPTDQITQGYYNPVAKRHLTFKVNKESDSNSAYRRRNANHERGFYPNFVHSIDGAVMRILILEMYKRTGYRIGHVHDCVLVHPNYVEDFYEVLSDLYTSEVLSSLADKLFFEPMKEGLDVDTTKHISEIQVKFNKALDPMSISRDSFNPRYAYSMEGSVSDSEIWSLEQDILKD